MANQMIIQARKGGYGAYGWRSADDRVEVVLTRVEEGVYTFSCPDAEKYNLRIGFTDLIPPAHPVDPGCDVLRYCDATTEVRHGDVYISADRVMGPTRRKIKEAFRRLRVTLWDPGDL